MTCFKRITDRGAAMVEYGLLVGVIALMSLSAVTLVGERTEETFDEVTVALDGDGTTVATADDDQDGGGDDTGSDGEQNEDSIPPSEDPNPPAEDDEDPPPPEENEQLQGEASADDEQSEEPEEVTPPVVSESVASTNGWTWSRGRYRTEWDANVTYTNSAEQAQYLTLVVTIIEDNGQTRTETVQNFEVPANGSATFTHEDNPYAVNRGGNNESGTTRVEVKVVSVTTAGSDGQSETLDVDLEPVGVEAPTP